MHNPPDDKPLLLIVDDTPSNLLIIHKLLKDYYNLKIATNGPDAIRIAQHQPQPHLILLDIMMPEMDGYQVCIQLKENPATRAIPVIFLTAMSETENEQYGFDVGAVDYITKPIKGLILKARIRNHLALYDAQSKLENINQQLLQERKLIEDIIIRMRSAKLFDDRFLRYLISSVERTNGDILLSTFTPRGEQWVLIGDFTGHGLSAALGAPVISHLFYSNAKRGIDLESVIAEIHLFLYEQLPTDIFMAGCFVEIAQHREQIKIWNAGMPPCLLVNDGAVQRRFDSQNLPLGIIKQFDVAHGYECFSVSPKARLNIFSDGLIEVTNPDGELFGIERAEQFFSRIYNDDLPIESVLTELQNFHLHNNFDDDITIVEISFRP